MATNAPLDKNKPAAKTAVVQRSFTRDGFLTIRNATIVFVVSVTIGIALVMGSQFMLDNRQVLVDQAQAKDNQSREALRQAQTENSDIQTYQPKYLQLVNDGFVGTEKRLDWMDSIRTIQKNAGLQPINYEIEAQQIFALDSDFNLGTLELRGSKMLVKMDLLHEADLLIFFNELNKGQLYDLQNCSIERLPAPAPGKLAPLLHAQCTLYWITIGPPAVQTEANAGSAHRAGL